MGVDPERPERVVEVEDQDFRHGEAVGDSVGWGEGRVGGRGGEWGFGGVVDHWGEVEGE